MAQMKLGIIAKLEKGAENALREAAELGFPTCQLVCWRVQLFTPRNADIVKRATREFGVRISALWSGYPGTLVWDLIRGPQTIGFPPEKWRDIRVRALKKAGDFARAIGVASVATHAGFIPENPNDRAYTATVGCLRRIAKYYLNLGLELWLETGQETPVTLLRAIEDVGAGNLGVNLDPANLIMYGKANPVDALDILGARVKGVHAKDGLYPTNGRALGRETPLGKGKVDFPALLKKLKRLRYNGALTIEREISGPQQIRDIIKGKKFLERILKTL